MTTAAKEKATADREAWCRWLASYGAARFYDAFVAHAQEAESRCTQCGHPIYLDIVEGGGVPDWKTWDGDYGCPSSPDTTSEGTGGHKARRIEKK
jgi:hypothetical protein